MIMKKISTIFMAILLIVALAASAWAELTPVNVKNGQIIVAADYEEVCPFSVETRSDYTYYVYLEYQRAPTSTTISRTLKSGVSGKQGDISFIVKPNSKVELDVPIGVYKLYYCVGETWYGTKDKFGKNTRFYASEDLLNFYTDSQNYHGCSLELWAQVSGNFDDHPITESGFPDTEATPLDNRGTTANSPSSSGSSSTGGQMSGKYLTIDDLPNNAGNMDQLVNDWLAYPAYNSIFHAVEPEVTINKGEKTKLSLFRSDNYNGASYSFTWYGGGDVSLDWAGNGVGWAGHSHVGYITATEACTIFMSAEDVDGIIAHMVIHVK